MLRYVFGSLLIAFGICTVLGSITYDPSNIPIDGVIIGVLLTLAGAALLKEIKGKD